MAKLIPLEEAAAMLGMSSDELAELRSQNKIFGYRDGSSWKFKKDEVNRVAAERGEDMALRVDAEEETLDVGDLDSDLDDLIELDDVGAGKSGHSAGSPKRKTEDVGSDLDLDADAGSDLKLAAGDSSVTSGSGSDVLGRSSGKSSEDAAGAADTANLTEAAGRAKEELALEPDELKLAPDDDFDLAGSGVELEAGSDDDIILDSGTAAATDSDVTLGTGDSGINLTSPSDSGLSLEKAPTELSGASLDSLELGEDDMLSFGDEAGEAESETQLKADDDFLLTPVDEDGLGLDESGSSSQVIALDTDDIGDPDSMLVDAVSEPLLEEDAEFATLDEADLDDSAAMPAGAGFSPAVQATDDNYSISVVLGLSMVVLLLFITGLMMMDLTRNMWSWNQPYALTSGLMDWVLSLFGG